MAPVDNAMKTTAALSVLDSATVTCVRRRRMPHDSNLPTMSRTLQLADVVEASEAHAPMSSAWCRDALVFGRDTTATFSSGWEVLMGQREVANYLRSTPEKLVPMRYPGEFTLPGGVLEDGESPEQAACREFTEEFNINVPADVKLRLMSVRQTRPVRNRSHVIYNYVIHEDENPWLQSFDVTACNVALAQRRDMFTEHLRTGAFWQMSTNEKKAVSPEVVEVAWLEVADAVWMSYLPYVNSYQATEFEKLGIVYRDPIFLTLVTLVEIDSFPTLRSLVRATAGMDATKARAGAIWLKEGSSPEEVENIFKQKQRMASFQTEFTAEQFKAKKAERQAIDGDECK